MVSCNLCGNTGLLGCKNCGKAGVVAGKACPMCDGGRFVPCHECGGTGEVEETRYPSIAEIEMMDTAYRIGVSEGKGVLHNYEYADKDELWKIIFDEVSRYISWRMGE